MSMFEVSDMKLDELYRQTEHITPNVHFDSPECPGGRCGNNCAGTCAWSPCTNLCAATQH